MNLKSLIAIFLVNFSCGISLSAASIDTQYINYNTSTGERAIEGPADSAQEYGKVIFNAGSTLHYICKNKSLNYTLSKVEYIPLGSWTGLSPSGIYLYDSGVKGLNLAPSLSSPYFNRELTGNVNGFPTNNYAPPQQKLAWEGTIYNDFRSSTGFAVRSMVYVYKGVDRIENTTTIPQQPVYRLACYDDKNVLQETATFINSSVLLDVRITGCTPGSKSAIVQMDGVPVGRIENASADTLINTKQQTFTLRCDANIQLYFSVVDLNDPTNNTNISTLTGDSTASGVGFAITSAAGARLQFGPDGSAKGIPGQTKYYIGRAGTSFQNNQMSHSLGFSYVRKPEEPIKTGTAKSLIGITYSYQ